MRKLLLLLALFFPSVILAQGVPVALAPVARQQFFLPNGTPNANGCVFTYNAGTTLQAPTYSDISGVFLNPNPVILDSGGFATIYLANQEYKIAVVTAGGVNCATGTPIYTQDNVSAFQIIQSTPQVVFAGLTSDPLSPTVGTLYFNSLSGRLRFFNGVWDTIPTDASVDTLTNKTFSVLANTLTNGLFNTAGHYLRNNGTQYVDAIIQPQDVNGVSVPSTQNCAAPGTVAFAPAVLGNAAGSACVQVPTTSQTSGVIGFCFSGCGTTGSAILIQTGQSNCTFDNATTAGDYVQTSQTIQGDCHDAGTSAPVGVQTIGRVTQTVLSGAVALVDLTLQGTVSNSFGVAYSTPSPVTVAAYGPQLMGAPITTVTYRMSFYVTQQAVGIGCTVAPTITVSGIWQDINAAAPQTVQLAQFTISTNGTVGYIPLTSGTATLVFRPKSGTSIQYSTTYSGLTNCTTNPAYQVFPILEQLTAN